MCFIISNVLDIDVRLGLDLSVYGCLWLRVYLTSQNVGWDRLHPAQDKRR